MALGLQGAHPLHANSSTEDQARRSGSHACVAPNCASLPPKLFENPFALEWERSERFNSNASTVGNPGPGDFRLHEVITHKFMCFPWASRFPENGLGVV